MLVRLTMITSAQNAPWPLDIEIQDLAAGQVFAEFRCPIGRSFDQNWKSGLGFRFLF